MQYHIDVMEFESKFSWENVGEGQSFVSRDRLELRPWMKSLPENIGGFLTTLRWKFTVTNTFNELDVFSANADQDVYFLPDETIEASLNEIIRESHEEFAEHVRIDLEQAEFGEFHIKVIDYESAIKSIIAFTRSAE